MILIIIREGLAKGKLKNKVPHALEEVPAGAESCERPSGPGMGLLQGMARTAINFICPGPLKRFCRGRARRTPRLPSRGVIIAAGVARLNHFKASGCSRNQPVSRSPPCSPRGTSPPLIAKLTDAVPPETFLI